MRAPASRSSTARRGCGAASSLGSSCGIPARTCSTSGTGRRGGRCAWSGRRQRDRDDAKPVSATTVERGGNHAVGVKGGGRMPWRARCSECRDEAPIRRPFFETKELFLRWTLMEEKILENASAHYEAHPRSAVDPRPCSGKGISVPRADMALAYSTTPGEDPPTWGRQPSN
jgi:hypothetical protein